jgi:hypothetical protein
MVRKAEELINIERDHIRDAYERMHRWGKQSQEWQTKPQNAQAHNNDCALLQFMIPELLPGEPELPLEQTASDP